MMDLTPLVENGTERLYSSGSERPFSIIVNLEVVFQRNLFFGSTPYSTDRSVSVLYGEDDSLLFDNSSSTVKLV